MAIPNTPPNNIWYIILKWFINGWKCLFDILIKKKHMINPIITNGLINNYNYIYIYIFNWILIFY